MDIPGPWVCLLLALAAYRVTRLLAEDEILDHARRRLVLLPQEWEEGHVLPDSYRLGLAKFITCYWCLGAWVSGAAWAMWQVFPHATEAVSVPLAIMAVVGVAGKIVPE
jgi:hypothetical protein